MIRREMNDRKQDSHGISRDEKYNIQNENQPLDGVNIVLDTAEEKIIELENVEETSNWSAKRKKDCNINRTSMEQYQVV